MCLSFFVEYVFGNEVFEFWVVVRFVFGDEVVECEGFVEGDEQGWSVDGVVLCEEFEDIVVEWCCWQGVFVVGEVVECVCDVEFEVVVVFGCCQYVGFMVCLCYLMVLLLIFDEVGFEEVSVVLIFVMIENVLCFGEGVDVCVVEDVVVG